MALQLRMICCVLLVFAVAACQTLTGSTNPATQRAGAPYFVEKVEVVDGSNSRAASDVASGVARQARAALGWYPRSGDAKILKIVLTDMHHRRSSSPLNLIKGGDTHRLVGYGTVIDKETGRNEGSFPLKVEEAKLLGRPVKLMAAGSDRRKRAKIEQELAGKFAVEALQLSYYGRLAPTAKVRTALFREYRSSAAGG